MALGAIQAIEDYGLKPGEDIKIVSIDAVRGAFEAMVAGKLNCHRRVQPPARPAVLRSGAESGERRTGAEVGALRGERLLPRRRRRSPADPPVLDFSGRADFQGSSGREA